MNESVKPGKRIDRDEQLMELMKYTTILMELPGNRYIEIKSPEFIDNNGSMIYVKTLTGYIYTAHESRVVIVTKPKEEKTND